MKTTIFLIPFIYFLPLQGFSQNAILPGQVVWEMGHKPLAGVEVIPKVGTNQKMTNSYGNFELDFTGQKEYPAEVQLELIYPEYQILNGSKLGTNTITLSIPKDRSDRKVIIMAKIQDIKDRTTKAQVSIATYESKIANTKVNLEKMLTNKSLPSNKGMEIRAEIKSLEEEIAWLNLNQEKLAQGLAEIPQYNALPVITETFKAFEAGDEAKAFELIYNSEEWSRLLPELNLKNLRK